MFSDIYHSGGCYVRVNSHVTSYQPVWVALMVDFFGREGKRPALSTDTVVFTVREGRLQVLLILRGTEPHKGKWALPGGFMEWGESSQQSAARELEEETNVKGLSLHFLGVFDKPGRDPRGTVVSIEYIGLVRSEDVQPQGGDDAAQAEWFDAKTHPELAFDHEEVIKKGFEHLRQQIKLAQNLQSEEHQESLKWVDPLLAADFTLQDLVKILE